MKQNDDMNMNFIVVFVKTNKNSIPCSTLLISDKLVLIVNKSTPSGGSFISKEPMRPEGTGPHNSFTLTAIDLVGSGVTTFCASH